MKNFFIVGGTKGIGYKVAEQLKGNKIYVAARNKVSFPDPEVNYIKLDITQLIPELTMLPEMLDGLIYCPGSINLKPFHRLTEEDFKSDWEINYYGAVKIIQSVLPRLKKAEHASIVLFSTVAAGTGMPYHASIASSKGAIEALTRSLAAEFSPRIRVNCIAPSLTLTTLAEKLTNSPEKLEAGSQRHPMKRLGTPEEIAELACYLLSDASGWMTGQILPIDGGMSSIKI